MSQAAETPSFLAEARDVLTQSRQHLHVINQHLHDLALRRAYTNPIFRELDDVRRGLEEWIGKVEAALMEIAPEQCLTASPPFAASMPKFSAMLGPPAVNRATSRGPEVANLQKILAWEGFDIPIDGQFSTKTQKALMEWQKRRGLPADGVVGASTRKALNASLEGKT